MVLFLARRVLGNRAEDAEFEKEAKSLTAEVEGWVDHHLEHDYPWPGNIRELEQCVRSIMVRQSYAPAHYGEPDLEGRLQIGLLAAAEEGLSATELERRYCAVALEKAGSYQSGARLIQKSRQTFTKRCHEAGASAPSGPPQRPR